MKRNMTQRLTILIVDDGDGNAVELLVSELKKAGLAPQWKRVETRLDFLTEMMNLAELILPEASIHEFSGLQAAQLLLESGLKIPFTRVSVAGEGEALETLKQGDTDYLFKNQRERFREARGPAHKTFCSAKTTTANAGHRTHHGDIAARNIRCWARSPGGEGSSYLAVINSHEVKQQKISGGCQ
ncbi:MAG TPA: response regulator [Verrucomicrobiae bacterium]|nr:response regulator [Verrucomicrobiae bacterium]